MTPDKMKEAVERLEEDAVDDCGGIVGLAWVRHRDDLAIALAEITTLRATIARCSGYKDAVEHHKRVAEQAQADLQRAREGLERIDRQAEYRRLTRRCTCRTRSARSLPGRQAPRDVLTDEVRRLRDESASQASQIAAYREGLEELRLLSPNATPFYTEGPFPGALCGDEDGGAYTQVALCPCPNSPAKSARRRQWENDRRMIVASVNFVRAQIAALAQQEKIDET